MMRAFLAVMAVTLFSACATYSPVVDPHSVRSDDKYYRDRAECRALADANTSAVKSAGKDALIGGAVGTGTGALIGAIAGSAAKGLAYGAVIGGVAGAGKGLYESNKNYEQIYRNCMRGRGYNVLN